MDVRREPTSIPDRTITEILRASPFTVSAEVSRLVQASHLEQNELDFLAVTNGAGGSDVRRDFAEARLIKENFSKPVLAHVTCRDLTIGEINNEIAAHHAVGIRNMLAVRGERANDIAASDRFAYAYQLVEQIKKTNGDICVGVACYPQNVQPSQHLDHFARKVEAGADFAITQILFDVAAYSKFIEASARAGIKIPILPGTVILKSRAHAERIRARFGVSAPEDLLRELALDDNSPGASELSLRAFADFTNRIRAAGAPGIHKFLILGS